MGKGKIGLYCYLTVDSFDKSFYRNVLFFQLLPWQLAKRLKCCLKAFIAVYSGEIVWHMGLWFMLSMHIVNKYINTTSLTSKQIYPH